LDLRGRKGQEDGEDCILKSSITCKLHQTSWRIWVGYVVRMEEMRNERNAYNILVGKPEGKRPL
jgi:hypothetical protein